jgi:hypothetical protein
VELGKLTALIGDRAGEDAVAAALDDLRERALVWGDSEVRVAAEASAGLPWYPGRRSSRAPTTPRRDRRPAGGHRRAAAGTAAAPDRRLADGRTRDAAPGTPADRPVQRLLAAGLLRQVDAEPSSCRAWSAR